MKTLLPTLFVSLLIGQTLVDPSPALLAQQISSQPSQALRPITEQYAVADDGTILTWEAFLAPGGGVHPNVLIIHGGGFNGNEDGPGQLVCAQDLSDAGMNAFIISYRLAPPGMLPGQTSDGRYPDQTNDVHLAVRAARQDPRGNGKVGAVGGSAGGSHTVYVAATGTPGDDQIDAGVSLSGAYNFGDTASWSWQGGYFFSSVSNYVGATDAKTLTAASPIAFIKAPMSPLLLYASADESMPPQQITDLIAQLNTVRAKNYQQTVYSGHGHAFAYWSKISPDVIEFLLDVLNR